MCCWGLLVSHLVKIKHKITTNKLVKIRYSISRGLKMQRREGRRKKRNKRRRLWRRKWRKRKRRKRRKRRKDYTHRRGSFVAPSSSIMPILPLCVSLYLLHLIPFFLLF